MKIARIRHNESEHFARILDEGATARLWTAAPWAGGTETEHVVPFREEALLAPVTPSKVLCVGRNYRAHAKELGNDVPTEPLLFLKSPTTITRHGGDIEWPDWSERVEHEGELAIVIGKRMKRVAAVNAQAHIFGYTCANDVTARDLQRKDVQFTRAKSFDTFCPVGPWIETDFAPENATIETRVNGVRKQHGNISDMVFGVRELLSFMSHAMTLEAGDIILTGTPEGVSPMVPGDICEVEISGIGTLRSRIGAK